MDGFCHILAKMCQEVPQILRHSSFGQRKHILAFKNMLTCLDLKLTVFLLLSEESMDDSKNPNWLNK